MYALECLFEEAYRTEVFHEYAGQVLWNINMIQNLKVENPNEMPQFIDLLYPEELKLPEKQTAKQIINNVLKELGWNNGDSGST